VTLGRFELGAIAIIRAACCPNAVALTAELPLRKCGSLVDALAALASNPSPEHVQRYDEIMTCVAEHQVRFPEGWKRVAAKQSRQSFDGFLSDLRKRPAPAR
jgi:hypothetical protein